MGNDVERGEPTMNPLDVVMEAYLEASYRMAGEKVDILVYVSEELREACLKHYEEMDLKMLPMTPEDFKKYPTKIGLVLAGKDCVVDRHLKGLSAYTRY